MMELILILVEKTKAAEPLNIHVSWSHTQVSKHPKPQEEHVILLKRQHSNVHSHSRRPRRFPPTGLYCASEKSRKPLKVIIFSCVSLPSCSVCESLKDSSQTLFPAASCKTTPPDSTWNGEQPITAKIRNLGRSTHTNRFCRGETDLINVLVVVTESQLIEGRVAGYPQAHADLKEPKFTIFSSWF